MRTLRDRAIPLALAAGAYVLALAQRPGVATADTKIDLHVEPVRFLFDVASVWSSSGGLGQVQAGQYAGYLFPMAPFYAAGHFLGLPPWLIERLWLGTLLAIAAWGVVRLLDALFEGDRGIAHMVAGAVFVMNPYVAVLGNRTSVTLLGLAALPWLLLCVHRGLRDPRGWWWPAAFALVLASSGGGVNAAVTAWVLVGPLLFLGYELAVRNVRRSDVAHLLGRTAALSVLASLWWIVPVVEHARFGLNFLPFTESVGAIWATTSLSESLRGMGYWISYLGTGSGNRLSPYFDSVGALLFNPVVVAATLLVPALALGGFAWTRRFRYAPFFLALFLLGTLIVAAGFPEGVPLRRALTYAYNTAEPVQFLRTTHKAAALVVLATACLAGMAAAHAWERLGGRLARAALAVTAGVVIALSAWPLTVGRAIDGHVAYGEVPSAWERAAAELDRDLPRSTRALVLPGQLFPFYRWGGTQDPILPALAESPVAVRATVPFSDLRGADLLLTTDSLVQQRRVTEGQLRPLLELMSVGAVVTGSDDDLDRSGSIDPAAAEGLLALGGVGEPDREYGKARPFASTEDLGEETLIPEVRRRPVPGPRPMVRVEPRGPEVLVDGSAAGLAALAALGPFPSGLPIAYAADRSPREIRRSAATGAELVITDTNRRRVLLASRARQSVGATLGAGDPISPDGAELNPFADRGSAAQTVAVHEGGVSYVRSPFSPNFPQFPEHRPFAAVDGLRASWWSADPNLDRPQHWLEVGFSEPREVSHVDVLPQREAGVEVTELTVGGREFSVRPGWNRLRVGLRRAERLRVAITATSETGGRSAGGLAEVRIPGLRPRELDRAPTLLSGALAGSDLSRSALSLLFSRESGDDPYGRDSDSGRERHPASPLAAGEASGVAGAGDAEMQLARVFELPEARTFTAEALLSPSPDAPDPELDRLAGSASPVRFTSSGRFRGLPAHRASRAFDGDPATAWIAPAAEAASLEWVTPRPRTLTRLRLERPTAAVGSPARIRVRWPGGGSGELEVSSSGQVLLPEPARARRFRLEVLGVAPTPRAAAQTGAGVVGISQVTGPGVPVAPAADPRRARPARCEVTVLVGGRRLGLRPRVGAARFESGLPLRAEACGGPVALGRGRHTLRTSSATFRTEVLRLRSAATAGAPKPTGAGRVLDSGRLGRGRVDGVALENQGRSWLVLGESYNRGWRAWCGERSLGEPEPIDGYANGWRLDGACPKARFAFAPNEPARISLLISGLGVLAMLGFLILRRRRRATPATAPEAPRPVRDEPARRLGAREALGVGLLVGLGCAFVFALRVGAIAGPLVAVVLLKGVSARTFALGAGALLAVVLPGVYLLFTPEDLGGFNSDYAEDLLGGHWVAVAAWLLLAAALVRTLLELRRESASVRPRARVMPE